MLFDPPPLLSQREFRATFVPYSRRYYENRPFSSPCVASASTSAITMKRLFSSPRVSLTKPSVITMKIGHFHPHVWPWRGHGNSRRSGNPEPPSCAKTVGSAKTRRVDSPISHRDHSCRPASGWTGKRALDSRCGENDRGQIKGPVVTTPLDPDNIQPAGADLHLDLKILVFTYSRPAAAATS